MKITRLSNKALDKILRGRTNEPASCVIKFYSNKCHFCKALKDVSEEIADSFDNVHFFAFNVDEYPGDLSKRIPIDGVPSIAFVQTGKSTKVSLLEDPIDTDETTWYTADHINEFIGENIR